MKSIDWSAVRIGRCAGLLTVALLQIVFVSLSLAAEGTTSDGVITAASHGEMPTPASIQVQPQYDTAENQELAARIQTELRERKLSKPAGTALRLLFHTESHQVTTGKHKRSLGEVNLGSGSRSGVRLNVWSDTHDSLIGGPRSRGSVPRTEVHRHLSVVLEDQATGKRLWEAQITYRADPAGRQDNAARAVTALAANLGKTVREQPLSGP